MRAGRDQGGGQELQLQVFPPSPAPFPPVPSVPLLLQGNATCPQGHWSPRMLRSLASHWRSKAPVGKKAPLLGHLMLLILRPQCQHSPQLTMLSPVPSRSLVVHLLWQEKEGLLKFKTLHLHKASGVLSSLCWGIRASDTPFLPEEAQHRRWPWTTCDLPSASSPSLQMKQKMVHIVLQSGCLPPSTTETVLIHSWLCALFG